MPEYDFKPLGIVISIFIFKTIIDIFIDNQFVHRIFQFFKKINTIKNKGAKPF